MIPDALTQRYDRLKELETARKLLSTIEENSLSAEMEKQFLTEKIQEIQKQLDDTANDAQGIIDHLTDFQARICASLHYQIGYVGSLYLPDARFLPSEHHVWDLE